MKYWKFSTWLQIIFFSVLFFIFLSNSLDYLDPDLGWHLKVGEETLETGTVARVEHFVYPLAGKDWVDHEWLSNIITFLIYERIGYFALNIFFVLIALAIMLLLFLRHKKTGSLPALMFFIFIGSVASLGHLGVRLQELTMLFLLLELIILEKYAGGARRLELFYLVPLFYLWSCLHAGFLIGLFVLSVWIASKSAEILILKSSFLKKLSHCLDAPADFARIRDVALVSGLSFISTMMTPYGWKLYGFLFDYSNTFYLTHIEEWVPFYYLPVSYWKLLYLAVSLTLFGLAVWQNRKRRDLPGAADSSYRISLFETGMFFIFLILSIQSRRHFPLFFITSFALNLKNAKEVFSLPGGSFFGPVSKYAAIIKSYAMAAMILVLASQALQIEFIRDPFRHFCTRYPCAAADFIKQDRALAGKKILNEYSWGGYLVWTWPEKQLFIDGRFPQYPIDGRTFLEIYYDLYKKDKTGAQLEAYGIELVLLAKKGDGNDIGLFQKKLFGIKDEYLSDSRRGNALLEHLRDSGDWEKIYDDDVSVIFLKK